MSARISKDRVAMLLGLLGTDPEEIAAELEKMECRGRRQESEGCPLANYLVRMGAAYAAVAPTAACGSWGTAELTGAQTAFVTNFDEGKYPKLVAEVR